jgi:hypothetical protein
MRVITAERVRGGFVLHLGGATPSTRQLRVARGDRREVECALRSLGVTIVDEYGARIDESQYARELDPAFNRKVGPGFAMFFLEAFGPRTVAHWLRRRGVRQSSDDA